MTPQKPWVFFLLGVQWLALFPLTIHASERFEDTYRMIDEEGDPEIVLRADPHAALHFGLLLGALIVVSGVLLLLRHRQGPQGRVGRLIDVLGLVPPLMCVALRVWVGCLSCAP